MAGVEEPTPAHSALPPPHLERSNPSSKRSLPNGPCNYRDVAFGPCGCDQFWDKCSAELHEGSTQDPPSSERSTWCVCGHHACFHLREARATIGAQSCAHTACDGPCQLQTRLPRDSHNGTRSMLEKTAQREGSHIPRDGRFLLSEAAHSQPLLRPGLSQAHPPGADNQPREALSQVSASGLPRVPSICLTSHDRRLRADVEARQGQVRSGGASQIDHQVAGLGLSLLNHTDQQQSVSSTRADDISKLAHTSPSESENPSTRPNSVRSDNGQVINLTRGGPMDQILEFNRTLQLDVGSDTIPNTYNPDEFLLSATEVATPSNANTPDLGVADQAVHETKELVETLMRLTSQAENRTGQEPRPASAASPTSAPILLSNSPVLSAEHLQQALRSGSPQVLQKFVSYLSPLHNLLNSMPSVASTMRELTTRMDYLENSSNQSFNHMPPEEIQQLYEVHDVRLIELETRMNHHEELHRSIDADQSSNSHTRRRVVDVTESFGSNHSIQSTTSSAMVLAAIERKEMETEVEGIKERLDVLEAAAMPSFATPWEVEVVLLPWGQELRGIWFLPDEPMHDPVKSVTQDSEEWTQGIHMARHTRTEGSVNVPSTGSHSNGQGSLASSFAISDVESGWSSQAIEDWAAGPIDEWLFAKACGSNNLVYRRLQSRGFVRDVTLRSANARDIQGAISSAFSDLLHHLKYTEDDRDPTIDDFPALRASFIPLRKVHKESRLRFLTPAEMSSSALWSSQFLASGVMMRVSGGKKRLYVTQREGYLQRRDHEPPEAMDDVQGVPWTWQDIRQLPRYQPDTDSQVEGNDVPNEPQVAEADAREACWAFVQAYDLPPPGSVNSSFSSSHHSAPVELSMRPADRQWRRSITPSSILKNKQPQPLSPLSVTHPSRPAHLRARTFSASIVDQTHQASSKRRFNASPEKHSSVPHSARIASVSISRPKRRRVDPSSLPRHEAEREQQGQVVLYNNTTRRSREPPSPFYSSHPELARTNSDGASIAAGKATPFAYATPYSGPVGADGRYGGFRDGAGDTEPDDDYQDDDGEQSWRGVDEDEDEGSESESDAVGGAEMDPGSFSGDDSEFGSEDGEDEGEDGDSDVYGFDAKRQTDEDEDGDEIFDTLLGVLEE